MPSGKRMMMGAAGVSSGYSAYTWGKGAFGGTGQGITTDTSVATQISDSGAWASMSVGKYAGALVGTDGSLWTWGRGYGQTGHGDTVARSSPTQVGSLTDWAECAISNNNAVAIKTDGTLWHLGGRASNGENGRGTVVASSSPIQIGALTTWSKVTGRFEGFQALKTDGTIWSWGKNSNFGQCGDNTVVDRSSPVQSGADSDWATLVSASQGGGGIKTDGTIWVWGRNSTANLGINAAGDRSSPTQIGAQTDWLSASMGLEHSHGTKTTGKLYGWGSQKQGYLGNGVAAYVYLPSPIQIGALSDWSTVSAGEGVSIFTKTDGTLWSVGKAQHGRTGVGSTENKSSPIQIGSDTTWVSPHAFFNHAGGLKS
tara:strand:+ start:27 stop:1136 length:1110 start_codon:yes stop_codon:yes gene_type:complete